MQCFKPITIVATIAYMCFATGCATLCSCSDTEMNRIRPYSGVRATLSDWEGCSPPWSKDPDALSAIPAKLYFRTIDIPLSFVMDTAILRLTWDYREGGRFAHQGD